MNTKHSQQKFSSSQRSETVNLIRARRANDREKNLLSKRNQLLNDDKLRSLMKLNFTNLDIQFEYSKIKRDESKIKNYENKILENSVLRTVFDENVSLIGFYEASLSKLLTERKERSKLTGLLADTAEDKAVEATTVTAIKKKPGAPQQASQATTALPAIKAPTTTVSFYDESTTLYGLDYYDKRKKLANADYKISLNKGLVKRTQSFLKHRSAQARIPPKPSTAPQEQQQTQATTPVKQQ